jgi:hypothetical protein
MRGLLLAMILFVALTAWGVGAWASTHTFRGGPQELYERPWLIPPLLFAALVKEAGERDYYRIKNIAILVFSLSILAGIVVTQFPAK